jgi:hypothetical protein
MHKKIKILILGVLIPLIVYLIYFIFIFINQGYEIKFGDYKRYLWIFNDSTQMQIDTVFAGGRVRKTDEIYSYIYRKNIYILIWEIKKLNNLDLNKVSISQGFDFDDLDLTPNVVLDADSYVEEHIKFGEFFTDQININLDYNSNILNSFSRPNYRGFYGTIRKMTFSDQTGENKVMINFPGGASTALLILYKANNSFYIILIDSDKPLNENIINILNLN